MIEGALFEGRPTGWPPLSLRALALHVFLVVPTFAVMLAGADVKLTTLGVTVHLPIFVPVLAGIGLCELWRFAVFRSTIYSILPGTLVVNRGVFRVKLRAVYNVDRGAPVELVRGDPAIHASTGWVVLEGLGPESRDGVRGALGLPPLAEPPRPAPSRCRERFVGLAVLILLVLAHVDGVVGWNARKDFDVFDASVKQAINQAVARFNHAHPEAQEGGRSNRFRGNLTTQRSAYDVVFNDFSTRRPDNPRQPGLVASVEVVSTLPWGAIVWGSPRVLVSELESAPGNVELLGYVKAALDDAGIELTTPTR